MKMVPDPNSLPQAGGSPPPQGGVELNSGYAKYVLVVLLLIYVLNFLDRQILAVLAEDIKADLGISDANMGFLFGTAFGVFYATVGMVIGRLADVWNRRKLIALGVGFWSLMTTLSGSAQNFVSLALYRFGVGAGETSATPASYSILYDCFSPRVRTTVLAIYYAGGIVGGGLGIFLGGMILDSWKAAWPDPSMAPFGLKGWQASFMIVGLPGLIMALWALSLREPVRGQGDGIVTREAAQPLKEVVAVFLSMVPVANLWPLARSGGAVAVIRNIVFASIYALSAVFLTYKTGDALQWVTLAIGCYSVTSWAQSIAIRDKVVFGMIFKGKALRYTVLAIIMILFFKFGTIFWFIPFFQRYHEVSSSEVGQILGLGSISLGTIGVVAGGIIADKLRSRTSKGKLYVLMAGMAGAVLASIVFLTTTNMIAAYAAAIAVYFALFTAIGPAISTINDLALPRCRATTYAFVSALTTLTGASLGPYLIGHLSDVIASTGVTDGEALRQAMLWSCLVPFVGLGFVVKAAKYIEEDESRLIERARELGEPV